MKIKKQWEKMSVPRCENCKRIVLNHILHQTCPHCGKKLDVFMDNRK